MALLFPAITPTEKMLKTVIDASLVFKQSFKGSAEPPSGKLQLCSCDQSLKNIAKLECCVANASCFSKQNLNVCLDEVSSLCFLGGKRHFSY